MSRAKTIELTPIYLRFCLNAREELKRQGLTQKQLAHRVGITNVQMCNILTYKSDPNLSMCTRIADGLCVQVDDLLF